MKTDKGKIIEKYFHIFRLTPNAKNWYSPEIQKDIDNILAKRTGESGREFYENAKYFYGSAEKIPEEICCALFNIPTTPYQYQEEMINTHNKDLAIKYLAAPHQCNNEVIELAIKHLWSETYLLADYYEKYQRFDEDMVFSQIVIDELAKYRMEAISGNPRFNFIFKFISDNEVVQNYIDNSIPTQDQLQLIAENKKLTDETRNKAIDIIDDVYRVRNMTYYLKKALYYSAVETMFEMDETEKNADMIMASNQYIYNATCDPSRWMDRALEYDLIQRIFNFEKEKGTTITSGAKYNTLISLIQNTKQTAVLTEILHLARNNDIKDKVYENDFAPTMDVAFRCKSIIEKEIEKVQDHKDKGLTVITPAVGKEEISVLAKLLQKLNVVDMMSLSQLNKLVEIGDSETLKALATAPEMYNIILEEIVKTKDARAKILANANILYKNADMSFKEEKDMLNLLSCILNDNGGDLFLKDNKLDTNKIFVSDVTKETYKKVKESLRYAIKVSQRALLSTTTIEQLKSLDNHITDVYEKEQKNNSKNLKQRTNNNIILNAKAYCDELEKVNDKYDFYEFINSHGENAEGYFTELNRRIKNRDISYFDLPSNVKPIADKTPHPYDLITDKIENIKKIIEKEEER